MRAIGTRGRVFAVDLGSRNPEIKPVMDEIVKAQLDLQPGFEERVRGYWKQARAAAEREGIEPDTVQFAQAIADRISGS